MKKFGIVLFAWWLMVGGTGKVFLPKSFDTLEDCMKSAEDSNKRAEANGYDWQSTMYYNCYADGDSL